MPNKDMNYFRLVTFKVNDYIEWLNMDTIT